MTEIRILDACCGSKMFWFDKAEPHTTYMDRREEQFEMIFDWLEEKANGKV